jgi:hypothetical protein
MLRLGARVMRVGVGEYEHSPVARDDAGLTAHVSWQAGVPRRIQVACTYAIAFGKTGARQFGSGFVFDGSRAVSGDRIRDLTRIDGSIFLRDQFVAGRDAVLDDYSLGRREPSFVVARREVARGRNPLDRMTELIDISLRRTQREAYQRICPPFPIGVKYGFILFADDWPETVHPAHVMDAVHRDDYRGDAPMRASGKDWIWLRAASLRGNLTALVRSSVALIGSAQPMKSNRQSDPSQAFWPLDLRVFAVVAGLWSLCLAISALIPVPVADVDLVDPVETIFAGVRFAGYDARVVLIVQAGIFAAIAVGVFFHRRWGLLLALWYMVEVVMSHLAFVIAYMPIHSEWENVRAVASQGPMVVLITLYLWIRGYDLIFGSPSVDARPQKVSDASRRAVVRENSASGDVAAVADYVSDWWRR